MWILVVGYGFMLIQEVDALQFKVRLKDSNDSKVDFQRIYLSRSLNREDDAGKHIAMSDSIPSYRPSGGCMQRIIWHRKRVLYYHN
jgi:hypothetical protein